MDRQSDFFKILQLKRDMSGLFFKAFFSLYSFPEGLNPTHLQTMIYLDHNGPSSMSQISHILQLEKGSFTPVAKKLIEKGYIEKKQSEKDKRIYELNLTPKGQDLVYHFKAEHMQYIDKTLSSISRKEQTEYFTLIEQIIKINSHLRKEMGIKEISC